MLTLPTYRLLRTGLFSDVTVKCGDRTWNLHKNIICSRCDWFKKALTGQFKEASTNVIEINDFEPRLVGWLIEYLYKGGMAFSQCSTLTHNRLD